MVTTMATMAKLPNGNIRDMAIVAVDAIVDPRPSTLVSKEAFRPSDYLKLFYAEKNETAHRMIFPLYFFCHFYVFLRMGGQAKILSLDTYPQDILPPQNSSLYFLFSGVHPILFPMNVPHTLFGKMPLY